MLCHYCTILELSATPEGITAISTETDNFTHLGYYAMSSGNLLPTFRVNLSVPSSGFKNFSRSSLLL